MRSIRRCRTRPRFWRSGLVELVAPPIRCRTKSDRSVERHLRNVGWSARHGRARDNQSPENFSRNCWMLPTTLVRRCGGKTSCSEWLKRTGHTPTSGGKPRRSLPMLKSARF
ncbi:hypothetical protein GBAR_LOCUS2530 [Geodia barretti]|uniref:Uncharacterized protein n=1 Tax=Geodia barretti TaxID=519541 RepID=A0AA35R1H2_GEOBA|nr:hypothetical protein GBAR_LOCUS2530 [Geodia barretti]